jgi:hypothetical protein
MNDLLIDIERHQYGDERRDNNSMPVSRKTTLAAPGN